LGLADQTCLQGASAQVFVAHVDWLRLEFKRQCGCVAKHPPNSGSTLGGDSQSIQDKTTFGFGTGFSELIRGMNGCALAIF